MAPETFSKLQRADVRHDVEVDVLFVGAVGGRADRRLDGRQPLLREVLTDGELGRGDVGLLLDGDHDLGHRRLALLRVESRP